MQLFGHDAAVMREAAAIAAGPAPTSSTSTWAARSGRSARPARAPPARRPGPRGGHRARRGEGGGLPVTVKLRPAAARRPRRRRAGAPPRGRGRVAGIAFHPRHASQQHSGAPDYASRRELVDARAPVILSGGLERRAHAARIRGERRGGRDARPRRARQSVAVRTPARLARRRAGPHEVLEELKWVIDCAEEHLGVERAGRYLRKFYPWYAGACNSRGASANRSSAPTTAHAREAWRSVAQRPCRSPLSSSSHGPAE